MPPAAEKDRKRLSCDCNSNHLPDEVPAETASPAPARTYHTGNDSNTVLPQQDEGQSRGRNEACQNTRCGSDKHRPEADVAYVRRVDLIADHAASDAIDEVPHEPSTEPACQPAHNCSEQCPADAVQDTVVTGRLGRALRRPVRIRHVSLNKHSPSATHQATQAARPGPGRGARLPGCLLAPDKPARPHTACR